MKVFWWVVVVVAVALLLYFGLRGGEETPAPAGDVTGASVTETVGDVANEVLVDEPKEVSAE